MRKILLLGLVACLTQLNAKVSVPKKKNDTTYCEQIILVHGLLTKAQLVCGFNQYSEELIPGSANCFRSNLGERYGKDVLLIGFKVFNRKLKDFGKNSTCESMLKEFPDFIYK